MSRALSMRLRALVKKIDAAGQAGDHDTYWALMSDLHEAMGGKPWDWPVDLDKLKAEMRMK